GGRTTNAHARSVAPGEVTVASGYDSRNWHGATGVSARTASTRRDVPALASAPIAWYSALLPYTVIHRKVKPSGTSSTPTTNSRTVRPREIRAMNMPTNGDHATHQPQ